jgi:uncharacterized protein YqhQ
VEENSVEARHYNIGGQAVLEGVMMRGRRAFAVAVRRPDGEIAIQGREISSLTHRFPFLGKFALRGLLVIVETIVLGIEALSFSAHQAAGEKGEFGTKDLVVAIFLAALLATFLFILLPVGLTWTARGYLGYSYLHSLLEGLLRLAIFLAYVLVVTRLKDIQRVFQYHGAEHKVVHAFEAGDELTSENAARHSPLHMGCGTAFLLNVLVLTIFLFAFIPKTSIPLRILIQLALIPFIAGFVYEIIRLARTRGDSRLVQIIMKPGLVLQRLTAREPSLDQIEVAIAALKKVLELEQEDRQEV